MWDAVMQVYFRDRQYASEWPLLHRVKFCAPLGLQIVPVRQTNVDSEDNIIFCEKQDAIPFIRDHLKLGRLLFDILTEKQTSYQSDCSL